ncbi:MAG: thiamine phosphate synthase [Humidesulfovibrio sp.]|nr:thiamine phosphate synthase [Humidesulfovibrio sp.]
MTRRPGFDLSLYLVTDQGLCGERSLTDVVGLAVRGGVGLVQLREKRLGFRDMVALGRALKALLASFGVPLLINDRVDVALAVEADGVHLGQADMPVALARQLLGSAAILGLSLERPEQLAEAEGLDVDYYGVSPVYTTPTKTDTGPGWGLDGLRTLRGATSRPLVGIGGIGAHNAEAVIRAGADGVAVVSAICAAPDPEAASRALLAAVRRELGPDH